MTREGTFLKPNDPGIKQADSSSTKLQAVNSSQHSQAEKLPALQSQNVGPPSLSQTQQSEVSCSHFTVSSNVLFEFSVVFVFVFMCALVCVF